MKFKLISSYAVLAAEARRELLNRYDITEDSNEADAIIVLGGDGTMLGAIHHHIGQNIPIFGMNRGSVGFLMNEYHAEGLEERVQAAKLSVVHPLKARVTNIYGEAVEHLAINDVSITRQTGQAAKLRVSINGEAKLDELIGDGLIVSTPVGSTAYNRSAGGPILPLEAPILAVTPICAFRPRHWKGAVIPDSFAVRVDVIEEEHRFVNVQVDSAEIKNTRSVEIAMDRTTAIQILCDPNRSWSDKILNEQFCG
ncbi:putative inorganic polyphosphate/ATP-NAD kinase [compost metagenome]